MLLHSFGQKVQTFYKNGSIPASFSVLFSSFQHVTIKIKIDESVDGVLGIRARYGRMEGTDESTELHRHPIKLSSIFCSSKYILL